MLYTNIWYVAASSTDLQDAPLKVRMLDRDFVLFRDETGSPVCLSNVCPHRGSSLARGKCEDGTISCPFHGWQFNGEGKCVRIPSQEDPAGDIPAAAKVDAYPVDREDRLMSAYWEILHELRQKGWQIDRMQLDELDRNGDYRVIPSPARRANPDGWVFDTVPLIEPEAVADAAADDCKLSIKTVTG